MISPPFADESPLRIAPGHVNGPSYTALNILKDIRRNYYKNNVALPVPNCPKNGLETDDKYALNPSYSFFDDYFLCYAFITITFSRERPKKRWIDCVKENIRVKGEDCDC